MNPPKEYPGTRKEYVASISLFVQLNNMFIESPPPSLLQQAAGPFNNARVVDTLHNRGTLAGQIDTNNVVS
jgi:hypothetical protein